MHLKQLVDRERNEKETYSKQLREVRDDSRRRIDTLERRNQELEVDNSSMQSQLKSGADSKSQNQNQAEKIRKLEMDLKHMEQQNKALEDQMNKTNDLKLDIERRQESLRREIDLLGQDKNFLQRENTDLEDKVRR